MSNQIDTALVYGFRKAVELQYQQMGSVLRPHVRFETQNSEKEFYDRIGPTTAVRNTSRHGDTPLIETPHDRRMVTLVDYDWADLIDNKDKLRMLLDPTSAYAQNAGFAIGRALDQTIIDAAFGTAYAGKEGTTPVSFDSNFVVASTYMGNGVTPAANNLNVAKLRRARKLIQSANAWPKGSKGVCVITASQLESLLEQTPVTSSDYNSVKALVSGDVNTFLGFEFVMLEDMLPHDSGTDITSCLCYVPNGLLGAAAEELKIRITERADKRYSVQVYAAGTFGASRMWEAQTVKVECDNSP